MLLTLCVASTGAVVIAGPASAAPAISVSPPVSPSNDVNPVWQFDDQPPLTYECSLEIGTPVFSPCTSPFTGSLPSGGTADGTYTFAVRETGDPATSTDSYVLDTIGRVAIVVASPTKDPRPSFDLQPETGVTSQKCSLDSAAPADCTTPFVPSADLTEGTHTLTVDVIDGLGNTGSQSKSVDVDLTPPTAPTITGSSGTGTSAAYGWSWSVAPGETSTCTLTTPSGASAVACAGGSYSGTANGNGDYSLSVVLADAVGNAATATASPVYTLAAPLPTAPAFQTSPPASGKDPRPTWTFTQPTSDLTCQLTGPATVASADCDNGTYAPLTDLADGSWTLTVTALDSIGNTSAQTSAAYVLDTSRPAAPTVALSTDPLLPYRFTWSSPLTSPPAFCRLVVLSDVPPTSGSWTACDSGQYDAAITTSGSYQVEVYLVGSTGVDGNVGTSPVLAVDLTAPSTPVLSGQPSTSNDTSPTFAVTVEPGATALCWFSYGTTESAHTDCHLGTYTAALGSDGPYAISAQQKDAAGNLSAIGQTNYLLDTTFPDNPVVTGPSGTSTSTNPSYTIATTEPGLSAVCTLTRDGSTVQSEPCGTPYGPTLSGDGTWVLDVTVTDDAGNASSGSSGPFVLDTLAPADPVATAPSSPGRSRAPVWTLSTEPGSTSLCRITYQDGTVVAGWTTCSLTVTGDLTSGADGTYTLEVQSTDAVGLQSAVVTADYVLDTAGPTTTFTASTTSPGTTRNLSFSFTTETGATVDCDLATGGTVVATFSTCTSPQAVSLAGLVEGTYTFTARATDTAGNTGPDASATYVLDLTAPDAPVLVLGPGATAPDPTPTWTFTTEANASVLCSVTDAVGTTVVPPTSCSGGSFTADLTSLVDGTYGFTAAVTDEAGNAGTTPLTATYVLDRAAPATPDVVPPTSPSSNASPQWGVTTTEDSVQCQLTKGTVIVVAYAACGPVFTLTLTDGDGTYTFSARSIDAAGNTSAEIVSTYRLDTSPPSSAVLTSPKSPSNNRSPVWTIAAVEFAPLAQCQVLGPTAAVFRAFAACDVSTAGEPYALDLTDVATATDGDYTLVVRLTDHAGNVNVTDSFGVYTLDTTAPHGVLVTAPDSPSNVQTPTWMLTGDSDALLECSFSSGSGAAVFAPCAAAPGVPGSGSFTADLTSAPDDSYTLTVRSVDLAGNLGPELISAYTLDTVVPATPASPNPGPSPSRQTSVSWVFSVEAGSTGQCTLSSARGVLFADQDCSSPFSTDLQALNAGRDSDYALTLRAVDAAGNTSGAATGHYLLDRTAPSAPLITAMPGSPSPDLTPSWSVQATDSKDRLECQLQGLPSPVWARCGDPVVFDLAPATKGTYRLQVRETDDAGNVSDAATSEAYVLDLTAPEPPSVLAPKPQRSNSTHPVFTVVADAEVFKLECKVTRFDGVPAVVTPCAPGANTVDLTGIGKADGPVVLAVRGTDAVGNASGFASATYSFDSIPPATPAVLGPNPSTDFLRKVEFSFGDVADAASYVCALRKAGQTGPVVTTACASPYKVSMPSTGSFTLSVWAVDKAGNRSATPATAGYTFLQSVPTPLAPKGPTSGSDSTPTWTIQVPTGYAVECVLGLPGGQALSYDCTSPVLAPRTTTPVALALFRAGDSGQAAVRTTSFTADLTGRPAGSYSLTARLTDALGNDGDYSPKAVYAYRPQGSVPVPSGPPAGPVVPPVAGKPVPPKAPVALVPAPTSDPRPPHATPTPAKNDAKPRAGALPPNVTTVLPRLAQVPEAIGNSIAQGLKKPTIPLLLLVVVVGFLLLQNQIDRRDPKLASAPVGAEPEMEFGPVRGRRMPGTSLEGGAPA